ncbi:unnamed protein product [Symbiodinium sp. CCMP2456]|nr:unnamed protein product [Symbiodinium sp. CCMP2456]
MASTSGPFKVGAPAELLINDYAEIGFSRGRLLEEDALRALPAAQPPCAVPDPHGRNHRCQRHPGCRRMQEPLLDCPCDPSRLICLGLVSWAEPCQVAFDLVDVLAIIHQSQIGTLSVEQEAAGRSTSPWQQRWHWSFGRATLGVA